MAVGILIIPLFDTIRVFVTRMLRGISPMKPDRRHIHHLLIDSGLTHVHATFILSLTNLTFISLALLLDPLLDLHLILLAEIGLALVLTYFLNMHARRVKRAKRAASVSAEPSMAGVAQTQTA